MTMPRRRSRTRVALTGGLLALTVFAAGFAEAQSTPRVYRIGLLGPGGPNPSIEAFVRGLADLGYVEGRNVRFEARWAEGRGERLPALAAELVQLRVDVLVAFISSAARAAQQATTTIPIVMVAVGDPVGLGLVANLGRPGGNITGTTSFLPELAAKRLQLVKEIIPGLRRTAVLWNPTNPLHESGLRQEELTARALGMELQALRVGSLDDIERAVPAAARGGAGVLVVYADGALLSRNGPRIAALALESRLPTAFMSRLDVHAGGLVSYSPDFALVHRRAATHVDRILKGARPADLPVEEPTVLDLVLNQKTARALGLVIPPSVLLQASQVIE
jgi:putative ABC transport system substrate-binding protein